MAKRVNAGLTQKEAAEKLDVSNKTVWSWEKGLTVPNVSMIDAICEAYGVTYDQLNFLPNNPL